MLPEHKKTIFIELMLQGFDVYPSILGSGDFVLCRIGDKPRLCYPILAHLTDSGPRLSVLKIKDTWKRCDLLAVFFQDKHLFWLLPIELVPPCGLLTLGKRMEPFLLKSGSPMYSPPVFVEDESDENNNKPYDQEAAKKEILEAAKRLAGEL